MTHPTGTPARSLADFKPDARFAWCVTGSGHLLEASLALALQLPRTDLFLSRAAEEVLPLYGWTLERMRRHFRVVRDNSASSVPVGMLYHGLYHTVVIAPATSNTVAKCALGLSDFIENAPACGDIGLSGFSEGKLSSRPMQESSSQMGLQFSNLAAHRCKRNLELA